MIRRVKYTRHVVNVYLFVLCHVVHVRDLIEKVNKPVLYWHKPLSQSEISSGDLELTRCKSTVKAICVGLANSANYPDQ